MFKGLLAYFFIGTAVLLQAVPTDYTCSTFLDLGPGNAYEPLYGSAMNAEGIDIGPDGNMYLSRVFKGSIWKVTPETLIATF